MNINNARDFNKISNTSLINIEKPLYTGSGVHPGCISGYFFMSKKEANKFRNYALINNLKVNIIQAIDDGDCDDLGSIAISSGVISTNKSPNSWCAVQAKSEGIPCIIDMPNKFSSDNKKNKTAIFLGVGEGKKKYEFLAGTYKISDKLSSFSVVEGQMITINGNSGEIFNGVVESLIPPQIEVYKLLTKIILEASNDPNIAYAWGDFHETSSYEEYKSRLLHLIQTEEFKLYNNSILNASIGASLKIFSTIHTIEGVIYSRLQTSTIKIKDGDVKITLNNALSGVGLLRSERYFRNKDELNSLRACILGSRLMQEESYVRALNDLEKFEEKILTSLLLANGGCKTVIRTLCMPFNKLFSENMVMDDFFEKYKPKQKNEIKSEIRSKFNESETFHGMRGARMHVLNHDLTKAQIRAILKSASKLLKDFGQAKITILVSMVTLVEEMELYIKLYDEVHEELEGSGWIIPQLKLAMMIETSAAYHCIEEFVKLKGRHIKLEGTLFGGNDFTSATLNMSRSDAEKNIVPLYLENKLFHKNPFVSINKIVCKVITRGQKIISDNCQWTCLNGFGGEQAGDWDTVSMLTTNAAPYGLNYITTSPDRIAEATWASYVATKKTVTPL